MALAHLAWVPGLGPYDLMAYTCTRAIVLCKGGAQRARARFVPGNGVTSSTPYALIIALHSHVCALLFAVCC